MSPATEALPAYLRKYVAEQYYDKYTAREHACWRYIMRQNRAYFSEHAVPIYAEGLKKTGIPVDRIPRISEMDDCLSRFGWGAAPVEGFIPPAAFLEFQARGVLAIACGMRTAEHIAYTPAPDIVHEAAGHAPIIAEPAYARYLKRYATMAQKAIQSHEDIVVYEAIRYLSDIKENPDTTPEMVVQAEARLKAASAAVTHASEATKVARMAWWTVEYGLVGPLRSPRIYGAGLLSSVGESRECLSGRVKLIPLTVACTEQTYNITEPQPQLFVAPDLGHLEVVLEELEKTLAFRIGGREALERARLAKTVNTVELDSGVQIGGELAEYIAEPSGEIAFVRFTGPVQLARLGSQLAGHGRDRHPQGFSTPVGRWEGARDKSPATLDDGALEKLGLRVGKAAELKLANGFVVKGVLAAKGREDGKLLTLTWKDCTVSRGGKVFFEPSWGEFDQAVGERVPSVHGGPPDIARYGEYDIGRATSSPERKTPFTSDEKRLFDLYGRMRTFRQRKIGNPEETLASIARDAETFPSEWLLELELLEQTRVALKKTPAQLPWAKRLEERLRARALGTEKPTAELISAGLQLVAIPD